MKISFTPVWFDSLGAKSSCSLIRTPNTTILIDPGIAIMHPSFPASYLDKLKWKQEGANRIRDASRRADIVVISHYHYDHYFPREMEIYEGKLVLAKNPNEYINDSQRKRAEEFYSRICEHFGEIKLEEVLKESLTRTFPNPMEELPLAANKDFSDYNDRRTEILKKGLKLFEKRIKNWNRMPRIPELEFRGIKILFPEGKELRFGKTRLRFTKPLFHGIEFSTLGWVFSTVIEHEDEKIIHSSDLNGPIIEDYAQWIIDEDPDILILDGPMTYMFGYLLNRTNLMRAVENAARIVEETDAKIIVYDHHLVREARYKERTKQVWDAALRAGKKVLTAAELLGRVPKVLECNEKG